MVGVSDLLAPLDAPIPPKPSLWMRMRRRTGQHHSNESGDEPQDASSRAPEGGRRLDEDEKGVVNFHTPSAPQDRQLIFDF